MKTDKEKLERLNKKRKEGKITREEFIQQMVEFGKRLQEEESSRSGKKE